MGLNDLENGGYPEQGQLFFAQPDTLPELVYPKSKKKDPLMPKFIRKKYHSPKRRAIEITKLFQRTIESAFFKALKIYKESEHEIDERKISDSQKREMDRRGIKWR